jgi:hypothetical protein
LDALFISGPVPYLHGREPPGRRKPIMSCGYWVFGVTGLVIVVCLIIAQFKL